MRRRQITGVACGLIGCTSAAAAPDRPAFGYPAGVPLLDRIVSGMTKQQVRALHPDEVVTIYPGCTFKSSGHYKRGRIISVIIVAPDPGYRCSAQIAADYDRRYGAGTSLDKQRTAGFGWSGGISHNTMRYRETVWRGGATTVTHTVTPAATPYLNLFVTVRTDGKRF